MKSLLSLLLATALVCVLRAAAHACSLATPITHVVDISLQPDDRTPPTLPALAPRIARGHGPSQDGCTTSAMSCDDIGTITFRADATDDTTPPERIGYRFTLAAGRLPQGLTLPAEAVDPFSNGLHLHWIDGASDDQEALDFTLTIVAIDISGNQSAPRTVRVADDSAHACAVARGQASRSSVPWMMMLVALVASAAVRRRRKR